ncbi:MAG: hypothetical protein A3C43_09400 [Candidatus Schekmanbacteria bacterium RIFCSPHIGHO2_02_FULL_38_11]|uniref:Porin n=1 Tax=Candidatus Schekmanbacteria bacterium RIFCSPLOWO2_12_FULL_38_15 TaxID=1817883 RepID=A0A1F7SE68_9BACT|nr:MAG: hypothetical protein A2043_00660 [Candidatus Schekmanbacteria bacterium GWA2_38_9]OGL49103.1 MAG: hypothetical protein A3H37_03985 [Candidatus Schekmanbacteria bacterium RIFCSPLOWO2_02_FULL_38_14]OGL49229.1 MAG: hypothetical protein A3C43_09400 [Candidatus Schekmanbacteria bacterium RIFCSPHIGHO2_02_FULL_38_11]OGL52079.1 MAG: hypothetical protein A3G31_06570 [Candidatus Schekmanbacteria bacterium RIFCSPLOWO2_12_FULL_38_15]
MRYFSIVLTLFFLLTLSSSLYAETVESLEKKLMGLQEEYQKKFDELKQQIDELKKNADEQRALYQNQVEEIKKATKEKEETNKKELEIMQVKIEEQKKLSLQSGYDNGFYIKSADDQFMMKIGGYLQTDMRFFESGEDSSNSNTFDIRRARIGVSGYLFKHFEYKLQTELDTADNNLTDAFININYTPLIQLQFGQFKKPTGYENPISSNYTDFVERALVSDNIAANSRISGDSRDIGVMLHGKLFEKRLAYYLGLLNGNGPNTTNDSDNMTFAGRIVASPFVKTDNSYLKELSFGGSLLTGDRQAHSSSDFVLAGRNKALNSLTVDGNRLLAGPELVWYIGPFGLKSEYYFQREERNKIVAKDTDGVVVFQGNMKDLITQGYYISAMYMLTGEERGDIVIPRKNFSLKDGGPGAWEVLARYEYIDRDKDNGSDPLEDFYRDPLAKDIMGNPINVAANTIQAITLGLNWYLNKNVRLKLNYVYYDYDKKNNLKNPDIGDSSSQFLTRFQVVF